MTQRTRTTTQQTTQQTANQVHPDFASVETQDGVTFSKGNMIVNGSYQTPTEAQRYESSNGISVYAAVTWVDPATGLKRVSCNCPGWAMKKNGKPRRCKHTDAVMGIKPCSSRKIDGTVISTISQAEAVVPNFEGRELRGIMMD